MGLYYLPFWTEIWWKDYKVQALPRNTRLIFYDVLFLLWDRDMQLANDDNAISYYLRITPGEWIDAKRTLLKAGLIQTVQADRRIDCARLSAEYEQVISKGAKRSELAQNAANTRWKKDKENK